MPHYMEPGARVSERRSPGRCVTVDLREPPATIEDPMTEDRMALVDLLQKSGDGDFPGKARPGRSTAGSRLPSTDDHARCRRSRGTYLPCRCWYQGRPGRQQHALLARVHRLDVHRPEPAHAQQMGHAAGIVAVGLDGHRRQRGPALTGFHQDRLKPGISQTTDQPFREWACLQADAFRSLGKSGQRLGDRRGITRHRAFDNRGPSASITHAAVFSKVSAR
jgi:hypothetical protein